MTKLRRLQRVSVRELATSVALGMLAGVLLRELGAFDVLGFQQLGPFVAFWIATGVVVGLIGWTNALVSADMALLVVYLVVAFTPVVRGPVERWVRNDPPSAKPLDAVVVLSGWMKPDSSLESVGLERLLTGMALVKQGAAPRLITTRVVAEIDGRRMTSDEGQRRMVHLVGLDSQWTEVDSVGTTHDEATRVAALLAPGGSTHVAVVTSPLHTRRACAVFEGAGLTVQCVAARENKSVTWHPNDASDRLAAFRDYVYERLGMVKYRYKGWIR